MPFRVDHGPSTIPKDHEGDQRSAGLDVPDPDRSVPACDECQATVAPETNFADLVLKTSQNMDRSPGI